MKKQSILIWLLFSLIQATGWAQYYAENDTTYEYLNQGTIYANKFVGRRTSSGEVFKQDLYTAAHWKIKLGTIVLVTCPETGQQVLVKVNDRCPKRGVFDLTRKAANSIGIKGCRRVVIRQLPERFRYYWEHQDELRGTANYDNMLLALYTPVELQPVTKGTTYTTESAPKRDNDEVVQLSQKSAAAPKKTNQRSKVKSQSITEQAKYDLDLCVVNNRQEALVEIDKLPVTYQKKVVILPAQATAKMKIRLNLGLPQQKVYELQEQLRTLFPNSTLRKVIDEI